MNRAKSAALWQRVHERNARRVRNLMIQLEGLWVKLGQYLSTRADVLPSAYIALLKQLQDSLPPRPLQEVIHTSLSFFMKSISYRRVIISAYVLFEVFVGIGFSYHRERTREING